MEWKKWKKDDDWWRGEQSMKKKSSRDTLENSRPKYTYKFLFCEQLPLCPSCCHNLPSKSLRFLLNQFDPYFHNIPYHSLNKKNQILSILWIYRFTPQNRQISIFLIPQKLGLLHGYLIMWLLPPFYNKRRLGYKS